MLARARLDLTRHEPVLGRHGQYIGAAVVGVDDPGTDVEHDRDRLLRSQIQRHPARPDLQRDMVGNAGAHEKLRPFEGGFRAHDDVRPGPPTTQNPGPSGEKVFSSSR